MLTLKAAQTVRTLSLALVMAMAGFCYSFATAPCASRSVDGVSLLGVQTREIGSSPLRFTNPSNTDPVQGNIFDLGDACFGSVITRYITATGGVRPYSYSATGLSQGAPSTLALNPSGCLMGSVVTSVSPLIFQVTVKDSAGTPNSSLQSFLLNMLPCPASNPVFRFAMTKINNGVLGQSYISNVATLNGADPVTFSVLPNSVTLNGVPVGVNGSLESVGLSLAADGTISGRPILAGLITFTARAVDKRKSIALSRSSIGIDQIISFNVEDNNVVSTDYSLFSCTVQGSLGQVGKDSIKFSGLMNLNGKPVRSLFNSPFSFQLGGATYGGRFNLKGQVVNTRGGPVVLADGSRLKASVNSQNGQLQGTVTKATLAALLHADSFENKSSTRLGTGSNVCAFSIASNFLEFSTRKSGEKFMLDYNLGKIGRSIGGNFQIMTVKGIDGLDNAGNTGDSWAVTFLAVPRFGIDINPGLDTISSVGFRIGANFVQRISSQGLISSANGNITLADKKPVGNVVTKFTLDPNKFTGFIQTNTLPTLQTGIGQARDSASANFTFGFDILRSGNNSPFVGENSKAIVPGNKSALNFHEWVDQNNKR